jgi:hypothetical protein
MEFVPFSNKVDISRLVAIRIRTLEEINLLMIESLDDPERYMDMTDTIGKAPYGAILAVTSVEVQDDSSLEIYVDGLVCDEPCRGEDGCKPNIMTTCCDCDSDSNCFEMCWNKFCEMIVR